MEYFKLKAEKLATICLQYQGRIKPVIEFLKIGGDPMVAAGVLETILKEKKEEYENLKNNNGSNFNFN
jgi:hypothetical protein